MTSLQTHAPPASQYPLDYADKGIPLSVLLLTDDTEKLSTILGRVLNLF